METFSELLNQYISRLGISDAELGRSIGVRRQTIFRWREGVTARPRYRDDVMSLANKLRLTDIERDKLLLAAGFVPKSRLKIEETISSTEAAELTPPQKGLLARLETSSEPLPPPNTMLRVDVLFGVLIILLILMGVGVWLSRSSPQTINPTALANQIGPAQAGETLILVTRFVNYTAGNEGFHVSDRIASALKDEIAETGLQNLRIAIWPVPIDQHPQATAAGEAVKATLIIYGEYDSGRAVARFTYPLRQTTTQPDLLYEVTATQDLPAIINTNLPNQIRLLALLSLGQLYIEGGNIDAAQPLLHQAHQNLSDGNSLNPQTEALINFYLGITYQEETEPHITQAIDTYTVALEAWPEMLSSRLNRSKAYLFRQQTGDLEAALDDINLVIATLPDWAVAYNQRAAVYLWQATKTTGESREMKEALALDDLNEAIALDSTLSEAYFNRGYLFFRQGHTVKKWGAEMSQVLELNPNHAGALNQLCWGYGVENQPEKAKPYCEKLITLYPQAIYYDSRGLVYALLGDYPAAIADFEVYIAWLKSQPQADKSPTLKLRQGWVETLQAGENPFTPAVLAELHQ